MSWLLFLFIHTSLHAQDLPGTRWVLNPKFNLKPSAGAASAAPKNFDLSFQNSEVEVRVRATPFSDEKSARQMTAVEFANVSRLYEARGNPYAGQITDVVECDKRFKPREFTFPLVKMQVRALLAGANARRSFGACTPDQTGYWVSYFNFYDPESAAVIETRIYAKVARPVPSEIEKLSRRLKEISAGLLQFKDKP